MEGKQVAVRFDPFDLGRAYAFIKSRAGTARWVQCQSMYWGLLQGHTERELMVVAEEARRRNKRHTQNQVLTAKRLAEFMASAEMQEKTLTQRLRDLATKELIADVDRRQFGSPGLLPGPAMSPVFEGASDASTVAPAPLVAVFPDSAASLAPAAWGKTVSLEELEIY